MGENNRTLIDLNRSLNQHIHCIIFKNRSFNRIGTCRFITFTFVLFGTYLLTDNWDFGSGKFRKAITISILTFFLATLAFANQIEIAQNTVLGQVFNNFWTIISTIVAFYFAARVVENNNLSNNSSK